LDAEGSRYLAMKQYLYLRMLDSIVNDAGANPQ
jgi:hypothetical protein